MLRRRSLARPALCTCGPTVCQRCRPLLCPYTVGCPIAGRVILSHRPILRCSCCLSSLEPTESQPGAAIRGQQGIGTVAPTCQGRFKAPGHTAQAGEAAPLPWRPGDFPVPEARSSDLLYSRTRSTAGPRGRSRHYHRTGFRWFEHVVARWPGDVIRGSCVSNRRRLVLRLAANCRRHGPPGPRQSGFR
jgi:hypothetical protein